MEEGSKDQTNKNNKITEQKKGQGHIYKIVRTSISFGSYQDTLSLNPYVFTPPTLIIYNTVTAFEMNQTSK